MKHKCKKCGRFERGKGCTACYPPAKCSGNLEIDCEDFITPAAEKARQEKLWGKSPAGTPDTDELIELIESIAQPRGENK